MGLGSYYATSPRLCFSTEDYNAWMNKHCHIIIDDDDKKINPTWFYLPYYDECRNYREFVNKICSHHRSYRNLDTCNYCQNDFKTFNDREVRCSTSCGSFERKLKTHTFEKLKELGNVYNIKRRRRDYIIDDLLQKFENYVL